MRRPGGTYDALVTSLLREDLGEFFFQFLFVQHAFEMIRRGVFFVELRHLGPPVLEQMARQDLTGDGILDDLQLIVVARLVTVESLWFCPRRKVRNERLRSTRFTFGRTNASPWCRISTTSGSVGFLFQSIVEETPRLSSCLPEQNDDDAVVRSPEGQIASAGDARPTDRIDRHAVVHLVLSLRVVVHEVRAKIVDEENVAVVAREGVTFVPPGFVFASFLSDFVVLRMLNSLVFRVQSRQIREEFRRKVRFLLVSLDHPESDLPIDGKAIDCRAVALRSTNEFDATNERL